MNRSPIFFLFLSLLSLTSTPASAAEPTFDEIVETCKGQYTAMAAVSQCVTDSRFAQAQRRDDQIVDEMERGAKRDQEILARIDKTDGRLATMASSISRIEAAQTITVAPVATAVSPVQTAQVQQTAVYQTGGGVGWQPIAQATSLSIYDITAFERDTLHVTDVQDKNSRERCGGVGSDLLLVTNHGYPVGNRYEPLGARPGHVLVRYDEDGDGLAEQSVWALDLSRQDDFWVTYRPGDDLKFVYLRRSGPIYVDGVGIQTVYRPPTRGDSDIIACRRDVLAQPGGHQALAAYQLAKVRE